ncbi:MAG: hypothetical protein U0271_03620 [Polyangiaceae bacterium]
MASASVAGPAAVPEPNTPDSSAPVTASVDTPTQSAAPVVVSSPAKHVKRGLLKLGTGKVLIHGDITREMTEYTANQDFIADSEAVLHVEMRVYIAEDADEPLVAEGDVKLGAGLVEFPLRYELRGDPGLVDEHLTYHVSATIRNHPTSPGLRVMMSEWQNSIEGGMGKLDFTVNGLERCGSPNSGGFCTDS